MQEPHNSRNRDWVHLNVGTFIISRNGILCTMTSEVFERPSHSTSPKKAVAQFKFDSPHDIKGDIVGSADLSA